MTIPEIRALLHALADNLDKIPVEEAKAQLRILAEATRRRRPVRMAPPRRKGLTPARVADIQAYAAAHPKAGYPDIADHFGVNQGRVSEALAGKRE
jgi:xanthine dehydrogenase iron-sulfur cluster and FAD-binding subunit A